MKDYYQDCKEFEMGGTKYYRLLMRCPVCVERDWPTVLDYWQHADCGGNIYLGDDATFYCSKCHETIPCLLAHYHCPNHEARGREYMISRVNDKNYPIYRQNVHNFLSCINTEHMNLDFLKRFMRSLVAQYE